MSLTQKRAQIRSLAIKKGTISYDFHIYLEKEQYHGFSEISFELIAIPEELVLDFKGKKVTKIIINGKQSEIEIVNGFLHLKLDLVHVGKNVVGVRYEN